jgi:spore coat protein A
MLTRRRFLQYGLAGAAALALPPGGPRPLPRAVTRYFCDIIPISATSSYAAAVVPFQSALRIPPVAVPVRTDDTTDHYEITMREGQVEVLPGKLTPIWGYDGLYPGPTIQARVGRAVSVLQTNQLPEPMSIHLHGGHVAPDMDGHPTDLIAPGAAREYRYPNRQRTATLWYHDHAMHATAAHLYRGLAAFYLITDDAEAALGLPSGDRDVPLLVQDRKLADDGSLVYDPPDHNGFFGNVTVVNGVAHPYLQVEAAPYRFRLLNGANARIFEFALDSGKPLTQIAGDGGLLAEPVPVPSVILSPAERAEVVIDFSGQPVGTSVVLRNKLAAPDAPGVIRFDVTRPGTSSSPLPTTLRPVEPLPAPSVVRDVALSFDQANGLWVIDGLPFDPARVDELPRLGSVELWRLKNESNFVHPIHLHLVMFQVLKRNGAAPPPAERGWKDTVRVNPRETVEIAARFGDFTGTYVYHCHVLEHEDHDMMAQFRVVDLARLAGAGRVETAAAISAATFVPGVPAAFVATAGGFADALAGGPAAAGAGSPVLLTAGDTLPEATAAELRRLQPAGIFVLGGPAAVPESVERELTAYTSGGVRRLAGESRYGTAAAVARALFPSGVPVAYVATGENFPDALAGGAAAAAEGGPVLLVARDELPAVTADALRHLAPGRIVVLGGPGAVSDAVAAELGSYTAGGVERLAGETRYETAAAVSRAAFPGTRAAAFVATGQTFPDALAGVPAAAAASAPLLLVEPGSVPPSIADELRRLAPRRIVVLGGTAAVSAEVEEALAAFL